MAQVTLNLPDELLNRMVMDFRSLAEMNQSSWTDEHGLKSQRISTAYNDAANQLIDQGFYGE